MNMLSFPKRTDPDKDQVSSYETVESLEPNQNEIHIADGGEFLDDGIRMKDQPFEETAVQEDE
jgi:hypothetical protein